MDVCVSGLNRFRYAAHALFRFSRIATTMCIRGVPKVYHSGGARTVGVRVTKEGGRPAGMRENRAEAAHSAGNRTENAQTQGMGRGNASGNRKSRTGKIRYGLEKMQNNISL